MNKELVFKCAMCGRTDVQPHEVDSHLCVDCVKATNNRNSYMRRRNEGWMEVAKENEIPVWEQQPGETQWEFSVWQQYRSCYPGKPPTSRELAMRIGTTSNVVRKISSRWNFPTRLQAYAKWNDKNIIEKHRQTIVDMNAKHLQMAQDLNNKIHDSIKMIDPSTLRPRDLAALMKVANDVERKAAHDDTIMTQAPIKNAGPGDDAPKAEELPEILSILMAAGALNDGMVGVKKTTEVIVRKE